MLLWTPAACPSLHVSESSHWSADWAFSGSQPGRQGWPVLSFNEMIICCILNPLTASLWLSGLPGTRLRSYAPTRTERRCAATQHLEKSNPAAAPAAPAAGHDHGLVLAVWFLLLLQLVGPERPDIPCPTCQPGRLDLHAHLCRYFRPDGRVFGPTDPPGVSRSRAPWLPRDNVIAAMAYPSQPRLRSALSSDNPGCLESYSSGRRVKRLCTSAPGRS